MCGWTGHIQDSEAEPLPVAETGEAELGPPSKFTSTLCRATEIWATATFGAADRGRRRAHLQGRSPAVRLPGAQSRLTRPCKNIALPPDFLPGGFFAKKCKKPVDICPRLCYNN